MASPPFVQLAPTRHALHASLVEAAWWCHAHFDPKRPATSLRSGALAPRLLERSPASSVDGVVWSREWRTRDLVRPGALPPGRLLVYFPEAELCDGAAMAATEDYLDAHNCPPHDTWVAFFQDTNADDSYAVYLVAWVPEPMVARLTEGIRVNPEECIAWLNDTRVGARGSPELGP